MKRTFRFALTVGACTLICFLGLPTPSSKAYLPVSALTSYKMKVYAVYTTADASCQTGFKASIPFNAMPQSVDLASHPKLGDGKIANPVKCVVIAVQNNPGPATWKAGTYTGMSTSGSGTFSDEICNAGGTAPPGNICRGQDVSWPAQLSDDAAAAGVNLATTCAAMPSGDEIIPVYISTNAACTGVKGFDAAIPGCFTGGDPADAFNPPTSVGDTAHGSKLDVPSGGTVFRFVVDFSQSFGAGDATTCGPFSRPRFAFLKVR